MKRQCPDSPTDDVVCTKKQKLLDGSSYCQNVEAKVDTPGKWTDFRNKAILAPMVRVSTYPMRLLALKYGADIVFNEELIDHKVITLKRKENKELKCVDFFTKEEQKEPLFRTFENEPIVFQIGTNNANRCVKAAQVVANDVKGFDLNMGCPKSFSVHGGYASHHVYVYIYMCMYVFCFFFLKS
ncbi:hypothetical protein RFI_02324 [Reticulomyxa filosa]|uniref:DUS-like FMN-binding domain-containing protein n=1 Tax=Reticulomyxa filosa TaxID=46433 RepID=X6PAU9_RETFI|nr:hypothetical protein RFI_02324 [Reticulomyxa filosa]|eukprot:ETO34767.1 hypothetical protein RFI_02324 [Reticulomyxa filosa]